MNDTPVNPATPEAPDVPAGPGQQMAARREELNWSVEEVAGQLNLAPRQVRAIEANDFSVLPVMAITRGFIRSYAKLLGLDAAPLLASISGENAPAVAEIAPRARVAPTTFSNRSHGIAWKREPSRKRPVFVILAIAVAAAVGAYQMGWIPAGTDALRGDAGTGLPLAAPGQPEGAPADPGTVTTVIPAPPLDLPAEAPGGAAGAPGVPNGQGSVPTQPAAPGAVGQVAAAGEAPATAPAPDATTGTAPAAAQAPAPSEDVLVLKVREDSWVELRNADKTAMIARVVKAGSTETFPISGPVTLVVGNARGVDATLRGKPVELSSRSNVARVNLK